MDAVSSGNKYDAENMPTHMLEDIRDESQSHPSINSRDSLYMIRDDIKQGQLKWKGALSSTRNMGKGLHKLFKAVLNDILQALSILGESIPEVSYFIL